jgi:mgtE-like transporter
VIYSWKKIVRYSLPLLTVCVLIEIFAGQILLDSQETLVLFPIFLISIPVINGVGGNIGSVLGARLASGLHVGYISISLKDKEMHKNLLMSIFLGIVIYVLLGLIIYYVYLFILINNNILFDLTLIMFLSIIIGAGVLLVCVVSLVSVFTAFWSFKKGLDPDDMVAPVVTTVGDVMGILFLFLLIRLTGVF